MAEIDLKRLLVGIVDIKEVHSAMSDSPARQSRSDKLKDAARALECDDDPERFRGRVTKLVEHKPVEKPE